MSDSKPPENKPGQSEGNTKRSRPELAPNGEGPLGALDSAWRERRPAEAPSAGHNLLRHSAKIGLQASMRRCPFCEAVAVGLPFVLSDERREQLLGALAAIVDHRLETGIAIERPVFADFILHVRIVAPAASTEAALTLLSRRGLDLIATFAKATK